jgi:ferrous iron transport protein A
MFTLSNAQNNKIYRIAAVSEGSARRRLLDMGFTPGAQIFVAQLSPFGGTVLVGVRGFTVALRPDAAGLIQLETGEVPRDGI